jgi:hypothetical protein
MIRTGIATAAILAGLLTSVAAPAHAGRRALPTAAQGAAATAADAAPFLGEWTLNLEGPNGPAVFDLTVKTEADKVLAEIKSEQMPLTPITDIAKTDKGLVLKFSFDYQGNQVGAVTTLTPGADKTAAQIDFADGAYVVTGTAVKKANEKAN